MQARERHPTHTTLDVPKGGGGVPMKFPAWCSLSIGILMFAQWAFFIAAGQVVEMRTAPVALAFHLVAEATTAILLIVGGVGLLRRSAWAPKLLMVANGLLIYTVIVSPGYFAQSGQWPLVGMFVLLLVLAVVCIRSLWRLDWA